MLPASASHGLCILSSAGRVKKSRQRRIFKRTFARRIISRCANLIKIVSLPVLLLTFAVSFVSCDHAKDANQAKAQNPPSIVPAETNRPKLSLPPDNGPPPAFNSNRAFQYLKEIVAFGPRPLGSANHKKVEDYILAHLKSDTVEQDAFTADTPEGKFPVHNIIAKFPGTKEGIVVIASHYDTNYPLRNTSFVGANDGGSSSALLLEIANQLRSKQREGYSVWLVWDDAEESIKPDTEVPFASDSLYGIRHLAEKWQADGTL